MDGVHDLGGRHGFGAVEAEPDEPVFHAHWEARAFAAVLGSFRGRLLNMGEFRHAMERMDPVHYLSAPYYERWLTGVATVLVERGHVDRGELERMAGGPVPLAGPSPAEPATGDEPVDPEARFRPGQEVRVTSWPTSRHTRCPAYVRGRRGVVVRVDDPHPVPDLEAHGGGRRPEPTCCVRFAAEELWGAEAEEAAPVHVDLWQSYLVEA